VGCGRGRSEVPRLRAPEAQINRNFNGPGQINLGGAAVQLDPCLQRARSMMVPQFAQVRFSVLA
jgi:hypothetical protein